LQRERGSDVTFFSPRAGSMEHHVGDAAISAQWARVQNDLIHRVSTLYPRNFAPVCMLPQSPGVSPANCVAELERCVTQLGFIGAT
jgi:4-oxalmesaconate hydratase